MSSAIKCANTDNWMFSDIKVSVEGPQTPAQQNTGVSGTDALCLNVPRHLLTVRYVVLQ